MQIEIVFIITAVVFTIIGYSMGYGTSTKLAVETTIDTLINEGYIKSRIKPNGQVELLKHNDE